FARLWPAVGRDIMRAGRAGWRANSRPRALPLLPRSPGKEKAGAGRAKPELSPRHDARGNSGHAPVSAREVAASVKGRPPAPTVRPPSGDPREITVTGPSSLIDLSPGTQQGIE